MILKCLAATVLAAATIAANMPPAFACACCSLAAQRTVEVQKIDARITAQLEASDFKHWTLLVHGRGTQTHTFYGELAPDGK